MTEQQTAPARRARTWVVPTVAALVVAGGVGYGTLGANASSGLPPKSPQEILTGVQQAQIQPLSGTVVAKADLGLPELPGGEDSAELTSLVSGSHTVRVWYDGPERMRLAKLGASGETDIIRNGRDAWIWSSTEKKAVHHTLAQSAHHGKPAPTSTSMPATPQEASQKALEHLGETSTVTTDAMSRVAGRDAYELVITPKQDDTLVKDVRIAVDGETMMPLRVQVYSTKLSGPAYEVGFSSLALGDVEDRLFSFTPPAGTTVEKVAPSDKAAHHKGAPTKAGKKPASSTKDVAVSGEGWSRVYVAPLGADALDSMTTQSEQQSERRGPHGPDTQGIGDVVSALPQASGSWGSGRVLDGTLFSVVLTDDGRVALGAVESATVLSALEKSAGR